MPKILLLDGGLGTTLEQNHGVHFTPSEPLWSSHLVLSSPETLLSCQRSFARVPVDILLTATYQISMEGLARTKTAKYPDGLRGAGVVVPVLERAVDIAHQAAGYREDDDATTTAQVRNDENTSSTSGSPIKLALSIGPYGACMSPSTEYSGLYDAQHDDVASLTRWHTERLRLFSQIRGLGARISFLAIETIPRRDEITAVRRALAGLPGLGGIPFWISCLYPSGDALPDGTSPEGVVRAALDPGQGPMPWGVGVNCTKVDKLDGLVRRMEGEVKRMRETSLAARTTTTTTTTTEGMTEGTTGTTGSTGTTGVSGWPSLVLYPDGTNGEVYNTQTKTWEPQQDDARRARGPWARQLADVVLAAEGRGVWPVIVAGGCCMAKPADISRLRALLRPDQADRHAMEG